MKIVPKYMSLKMNNVQDVLRNLPIQLFGPPNVTAKFVPLFIFEGFPHGWAESAASIIPHGGVWFGGKSLTLIRAF